MKITVYNTIINILKILIIGEGILPLLIMTLLMVDYLERKLCGRREDVKEQKAEGDVLLCSKILIPSFMATVDMISI